MESLRSMHSMRCMPPAQGGIQILGEACVAGAASLGRTVKDTATEVSKKQSIATPSVTIDLTCCLLIGVPRLLCCVVSFVLFLRWFAVLALRCRLRCCVLCCLLCSLLFSAVCHAVCCIVYCVVCRVVGAVCGVLGGAAGCAVCRVGRPASFVWRSLFSPLSCH